MLSFIFSGLGQVYNGELKKGIYFLLGMIVGYHFLGLTGILTSFKGMVIYYAAIIVYKLLISVEAYRTSVNLNPYKIKSINHIGKYFLFVFLIFTLNFISSGISRILIGYEAYIVPTSNMEPTIEVDDMIMATKSEPSNIKIGEIISFRREDGEKYICRVLGLPGDRIQFEDDKAIINGQSEIWQKKEIVKSQQFEYQKYKCELPNGVEFDVFKTLKFNDRQINIPIEASNMNETRVPPQSLFVVGDNRNNSIDSRTYGSVSFENLDKTVHYVYWSNDRSRIGTKLNK